MDKLKKIFLKLTTTKSVVTIVILVIIGSWLLHLGFSTNTKYYNSNSLDETGSYLAQNFVEDDIPRPVMMESKMMIPPNFEEEIDQGGDNTDRMIIKTANFEIETENPETTFENLRVYIKNKKGFIENSSINQYGYNKKSVYCTLRIPSDHYEEVRHYLNQLGYVKSQSEGSDDVTETYTDYTARLANLKAQEDRVRNMYDKAKEISDIISLESELTKLRDKIERLERQVKNLEKKSSFSTISVNLVPEIESEPVVTKEWNLSKVWKKTVNSLKTDLKWWFEQGVSTVVYSVIWLPILLIIFGIRKFLLRKK